MRRRRPCASRARTGRRSRLGSGPWPRPSRTMTSQVRSTRAMSATTLPWSLSTGKSSPCSFACAATCFGGLVGIGVDAEEDDPLVLVSACSARRGGGRRGCRPGSRSRGRRGRRRACRGSRRARRLARRASLSVKLAMRWPTIRFDRQVVGLTRLQADRPPGATMQARPMSARVREAAAKRIASAMRVSPW